MVTPSRSKTTLQLSDLSDENLLDDTDEIGEYFEADVPSKCIHIVIRSESRIPPPNYAYLLTVLSSLKLLLVSETRVSFLTTHIG